MGSANAISAQNAGDRFLLLSDWLLHHEMFFYKFIYKYVAVLPLALIFPNLSKPINSYQKIQGEHQVVSA